VLGFLRQDAREPSGWELTLEQLNEMFGESGDTSQT
jgi:hypothetical protein